jgi:hypothetical protein
MDRSVKELLEVRGPNCAALVLAVVIALPLGALVVLWLLGKI